MYLFLPNIWQRVIFVCVAMTFLFPSFLWAENAKFDPVLGSLHLPVVEVPGPNGEIVCYQADLGLMPNNNGLVFSLSNAASVDCGNPQICQNPGTPAYNECQNQRLLGTWSFSADVDGSPLIRHYSLTEVIESSDTPGEYFVIGTNEEGELIVARYNAQKDWFSLQDPIPNTDDSRFLVFDFASGKSVYGCLYLFIGDDISDCHQMSGTQTSQQPRVTKRFNDSEKTRAIQSIQQNVARLKDK
jgi:hypothetical protein